MRMIDAGSQGLDFQERKRQTERSVPKATLDALPRGICILAKYHDRECLGTPVSDVKPSELGLNPYVKVKVHFQRFHRHRKWTPVAEPFETTLEFIRIVKG